MKHLFTLLSLLLLLPVAAWGQTGEQTEQYIYYIVNDDGTITEEKIDIPKDATQVTATDTEWKDGWYVVKSNVIIGSEYELKRVTVTGKVHLILADGCSLTVNGGIEVQDDDNNPDTPSHNCLTIYAQSTEDKMGTLVATGGYGAAAIGGGYNGDGGTITIHGGNVTATGDYGAGIGGGRYGSGGTITISGGTVIAKAEEGEGGGSGAGIGGGGSFSNIGGSGGTITIHGGTVEATGGNSGGAGIGGGGSFSNIGGSGGTITISGGTVTATGKNGGAGIGDGKDYSGTDRGSFSTGTDGNAFIIASSISDQSGSGDWSGVIFEGDNAGAVYGSPITLTTDATIPAEKTLVVNAGQTLEVGKGVTLTNEGTLTNAGTIINYGTIDGTGTVSGNILTGLTEDMITVAEATYTGEAIEPEVTVSKGSTTFEGTDYTVSYSNNTDACDATAEDAPTVTVTPKGTELGGDPVSVKFTIEKASATLSFAKETVSATIGETVENTLTVTPVGVAVSYGSSNNGVATVDASTGAITLVGAGETTITATINNPNYQGEVSYTLIVRTRLGEGDIMAEGETNISIEMDGTSFELTAKVTADEPGTDGTWVWTSSDINVATVSEKGDAASGYSLRATTDPKTSTAIVTPVAVGTATITATYTDSKYTGSVTYTVTVTEPYVPKPPVDPISYYNIYVEDVCEGVEVTTSKNVVREGGSISLYVEKDTANYTFDNFQVYYKRSYYGPWEVLEEGTQPGEYPIRNIWTHIYVKAEGAEEKEDPTGIEQVEGVKVYTKDGSLYVQTPQREQVLVITMTGVVVKNEEQVGLKQYHGLQPGIYIVRVGDRAYKIRIN